MKINGQQMTEMDVQEKGLNIAQIRYSGSEGNSHTPDYSVSFAQPLHCLEMEIVGLL